MQGLVAAAFTHRDSRAGDPDLHTHVAVANKVQTLDGRWLSIDGRILFKATVAASETYNTALEQHLRDSLGLRFAERPNQDPRKRPIREIVGVDPALNRPLVGPSSRHRDPAGRAGRRFPTRPRPPTHPGGIAAAGPAGHPGNPAKPNTNRAASPSNGRHGLPKPPTCWAGQTPCSHGAARRSAPSPSTGTGAGSPAGSTQRRIGCCRRWRNAAPPGRSGMYAPRHNATSEPPTYRPRRPIGSSTCSSTKY